ncbi:MAG: LCP family protein [Actinomycetota bacterium]|nr:LCP family protein [Actinomycetota bacterium]
MTKVTALLAGFVISVTVCVPLIGSGPPSSARPVVAGRVHARFQPTGGKVYILVLGSDAREGNPDNVNVDAIHVVGINTKTMRGGILNFPRDSWVSIPGYRSGKINEALHAGGPVLVAKTIEQLTGIRVDYWVLVGFRDFQAILSELGRVKMHIPRDVYDPGGSGASIKAGTRNLTPWAALAYVRTRHGFPDGDIDRTTNQARFLIALLSKLRGEVRANPASVLTWIAATRRYARFDMSADDMFRLGILASQLDPKKVGNVTVPVSLGFVGAASVVYISPSANAIFKRFRRTAAL